MKELVANYFNFISKIGIVLILLSSFFVFTNLTTEFFDTAKFLVLVFATGVLLVLVTLRFALNNKVTLVRTPLDIPLILLLMVGIVSTFFSAAPFVSILGNQLRVHGSLVSLATYILFYFVLVNTLKNKKEVSSILSISVIAAGVLSVITLLSYWGVKLLPSPWTYGINFTPTGSSFSTAAILALLVPVATSKILTATFNKRLLNSVFLALFGVTIVLTGDISTWLASFLGFVLTFVFLTPFRQTGRVNLGPAVLIALAAPLAVTALVALLTFIPPVGGAQNPFYTQSRNFPREITAPFVPSWKIAVSSFRDSPFWGSGPANYFADYTAHKPIEVNSSNVWNLRFDTSFNEYFQVLATLGGVGLVALLSLTALFITSSYPVLASSNLSGDSETFTKKALAVSGLVFFAILALHPSTLPFLVFGLFLLAGFYVMNLSESRGSWGLSGNIQNTLSRLAGNITSGESSQETIKIEALPSVLLTIVAGLVIFVFFFTGKFALADFHHRNAINAVSQNNGIGAYNELVVAERLNPHTDLYRTDLAQINFALANAIASAKGPTEASPSGSLTAEDQQNIQTLLQQSINEGRAATVLNPRSALNWEILGLLYRQIAGVAENALVFSLDSYGRAIFADPLNPNLRLAVGGVYYAIQNYDMAIRFFTDAINLKTDFVNGYYNLSVALRDKGDLNTAQAAAERMLELIEDKNSQDYKLGEQYLSDLKNRIASGSAQESGIKPPASQTQSALEEEELPKVVDVGTPPQNIATPPAVEKPDSTPAPTATPQP